MTAPDQAPIPPATLRVTVVWPDGSHDPCTVDIATDRIVRTLRALEDHVGSAMTFPRTRRAAYAAMATAIKSADEGDTRVVTSAGLWLFLHHPGDEHATTGQRLSDALEHGASALLLAMVGRGGGRWTYRLHPMPRLACYSPLHDATKRASPSMITHEFNSPILPGTLRISVLADDELYAADFPTSRLAETLRAFEHHAGTDASVAHTPQAADACREKAAAAVDDGDAYLEPIPVGWPVPRR
jgi:hypothetical protein